MNYTLARQSLQARAEELARQDIKPIIIDHDRVEFTLPNDNRAILVWEYSSTHNYFWYIERLGVNGCRISQHIVSFKTFGEALRHLDDQLLSQRLEAVCSY